MARITVEKCLKFIPNRFDLVIAAAKRARQLMMGADPGVPTEHDKAPVLALREIEQGLTHLADQTEAELAVRQAQAQTQQRHINPNVDEDDE